MSRRWMCFVACVFLFLAAPASADEPKKVEATKVKSFRELSKAKKGRVFLLHVAPSGVLVGSPGTLYAEPCDPKDPAIQKRTGLVGTVQVEDVPEPVSEQMNAKNNEELEAKSALTCYSVTAKLKSTQGGVTLSFVSAEPSGTRPYDERLNPARGD
ncbi:hypothetical protein [Hyalangium rubrum]|uniref:Lipoprotein n=1 Tax=Hyalangium rubrum TaxID=3103134 RepID=A0ABU5H0D5_9BACT|nr:hypothetical protein [Hyalangium sp. s54d21]MDY7226242.1 hypothetical protein [Hyalangium sp. s54d21]